MQAPAHLVSISMAPREQLVTLYLKVGFASQVTGKKFKFQAIIYYMVCYFD